MVLSSQDILERIIVMQIQKPIEEDAVGEEGGAMLALAHHKKRHALAITGRSALALMIAITALANIITV